MKKLKIFILIGILFGTYACSENLEEKIISVHPNNVPALIEYYKTDDTTGNPVKIIRFYINGEKREEYHLKNGMRHGPCRMWHVNGNKKTECNYFENLYDGEFIEWFDDGTKNYEGFFNKGQASGSWKFYNRDGSLQSETTYE
ncbi:MAG: hypothetical protein PF481_02875 [Bacteroidales bacterium]|jgi:antitoxin component YwqK of YwqJK toxin-antitoxin module|nr:hypothetical protein [Bacteroidales bacterium]